MIHIPTKAHLIPEIEKRPFSKNGHKMAKISKMLAKNASIHLRTIQKKQIEAIKLNFYDQGNFCPRFHMESPLGM